MTGRVYVCAAVIAAGISIFSVGVTGAIAQTKPSTETKPATESKPAEEKFQSPFGGTKAADSAEAMEFEALVKLQDEVSGWDANVKLAEKCGDQADIKKMKDHYEKAKQAFNEAVKKYVMDWSPRVYQTEGKVSEAMQKQIDDNFHDDYVRVLKGLYERRTSKDSPAKCPVKHHHKVYSEDDPRYMEDYQPAPKAPTHTPPSHNNDGPGAYPYPYPYPPPQGDDQPSHPPPQPYDGPTPPSTPNPYP